MTKIKVLLIQNYIAHYNLPIFNSLGEQPDIDLTLAHFGNKKLTSKKNFVETLMTIRKTGPIYTIKEDLLLYCNNFHVVIALGDIHFISLMLLGRNPNRKFKLVFWGIGVSASYTNKLGENRTWDFLRFYFMKGADALLFYSSYPIDRYLRNGFSKENLFVADNTVEVIRTSESSPSRNSILFIGTLYKEKGIYELLSAYKEAWLVNNDLPVLNIIGDGAEFQNIVTWSQTNNLEHRILLHGVIYDDIVLEKFFREAIVSISPNQAGLSVLKSMGYGVPFVTRFDSITGGERLNITNNETGLIYNSPSELVEILCSLFQEKEKYRQMGEKARKHYESCRLPQHMVKGFLDVIHYVNNK